ncbi:zeta toxin (plasmid) [Pedobacter sp. BS3]|uniref:zeta toxin family protein n=1 Tax=Pedobacter sp. BS3 TaxID=2567937 RepID=UPI0011ED87F8|nr:zeta toxin family protein [Pedobacter sp. BS3]TZF85979.1 zeta toxin [Pedobacter sp. BS3]
MPEQHTPQLRLRIFAGPNGSGKSTVIKKIRETEVNNSNLKLDIGIYVNADDIAKSIASGSFTFSAYEVSCEKATLLDFADKSGLLFGNFTREQFEQSFELNKNHLKLLIDRNIDRVAQITARYLRKALLDARKRFSFETVFSHKSNLDIMQEAVKAGYKVYLYFVATESPEINKYRVELRVREGGHNVPSERIEQRYYRALELLYDAAEIAYQAFFFDNSIDNEPFRLVGHFKKSGENKIWDDIPKEEISYWFKKYYLNRISL